MVFDVSIVEYLLKTRDFLCLGTIENSKRLDATPCRDARTRVCRNWQLVAMLLRVLFPCIDRLCTFHNPSHRLVRPPIRLAGFGRDATSG